MLTTPFSSDSTNIDLVGGKGSNLVRLTRAGFNVPRGFIINTNAYRKFVHANDLERQITSALPTEKNISTESLEIISNQIRSAFSAGCMPSEIEVELGNIYRELKGVPLAVRSSATLEDLPDLSFAGQQDTFLNVIGETQLQKAVIDCWSSLWTARAIGYRMRNDISPDQASLAVVIQEMVTSQVSGVMFTANPVTGMLFETVIDATPGLGDALVSGLVDPDHFEVDTQNRMVKVYKPGSKQVSTRSKPDGGVETIYENHKLGPCIAGAEVAQLVDAGQTIQKEFGTPQDIEWAMADGHLYILQSRAITSLFPVPEISFDPLIAWFAFGAVQGLVGPLTPLGKDTIMHVVSKAGELFGIQLDTKTVRVFAPAGERIWIRISDVIRNPLGSHIFHGLLDYIEPSIGQILAKLSAEPRLGAGSGILRFRTIRAIAYFALPILARFFHNLTYPQNARDEFDDEIEKYLASTFIAIDANRFSRLKAIVLTMRERTANVFRYLLPKFIPIFAPAMASLNLLNQISGDHQLALEVTRGLPRNVTTEMDLALWQTAQSIRASDMGTDFRITSPEELAARYLSGDLPDDIQSPIRIFLDRYGMRGVGEIDFGQKRWREDPAPVMHTLQSYLNADPLQAPDLVFARGNQAALTAIETIATSVRNQPGGWLKEKLVRAAARRIRLLMGVRESPKFFAIRTMGIARKALLEVGAEFVAAGTINLPDDLTFFTIDELEQLAQAEPSAEFSNETKWKNLVAARRAAFIRELRRRQIPRVLTSDGRAFFEGIGAATDSGETITGNPVSPGRIEGVVHVVLDPRGTQLVPGEILVCPGTDPAWTPLFLVAGGLITEVGGMMTHGSVVAREYGIPAVVGVHQATLRLKNGQKIRLDGSTGSILIIG